MRGGWVVSVAAVTAVLAAAGCVAQHSDDANTTANTAVSTTASSTATAAPQAHGGAPAPKDPDLGTVMERFYQQVEGEHWPFAYAMLSPRYRAGVSQAELVHRYAGLVAPDVALRQLSDTKVVAHIDAHDRADRTRALHVDETVTLAWDGEQWTIDDITRRERGAAGTR